jgi:hypothetical protein
MLLTLELGKEGVKVESDVDYGVSHELFREISYSLED